MATEVHKIHDEFVAISQRCNNGLLFDLIKQSIKLFLAHRIRKSEVFTWDRNSYLTHVISPQKEFFHVNSVCIGCIGRHETLSVG